MECRMNPNEKLQLPDHLIARGAKVQLRRTMACLLLAVLIGSTMGEAKVLAVPDVLQGTDYPCWIASASSVLTYYGKAIPMCYILDFVYNKTGKIAVAVPSPAFAEDLCSEASRTRRINLHIGVSSQVAVIMILSRSRS